MVRMNPLNDVDGEANAAGDSAKEDSKSASAGSFKRTRSSLDYKGDPSSDTIIPQEIQSKLFEAGAKAGASRSKGQADSEQYNPFAGMSSEEILRHLYENPELAKSLGIDPAVAGAAAGITKKTYRTQLLQKQGFPFVQWAIVLVIFAFVGYRAYKYAKPQPATVKQKVKRKGGKKISDKPLPKDDLVLSKVIAEIEGAGDDAKDASDKGQQKKSKKKQVKKAKAKPSQAAKSKEDSESDDSDAEPAPRVAAKSKKKKVKLVDEPVPIIPEEDSSDWHVVGAKAAPATVATTNGTAPKPVATEEAAAQLNGSDKPDDSEPAKKKKKPKKKKADNGKAPSSAAEAVAPSTPATNGGGGAVVDDDEALALRLQAEENNFASPGTPDDAWAEVATKKKKSKVVEQS